MALIVLPGGEQRSGSIGGTVFSRNRFGAYIRNRSMPVNPQSGLQTAVRNIVRGLAIAWNTELTVAHRNAWLDYAENVPWTNHLGQQVYLTGLNHFIRSNTPRLQAGAPRIDDGPSYWNLAAAEGLLTGSASEATQLVSVGFASGAAWIDEDGAYQIVYMGIPQNASRGFFNGPWRLLVAIPGNSTTPPSSPVTATAPYPVSEAQKVWIRSRISRADGRLSEFARDDFLVAA